MISDKKRESQIIDILFSFRKVDQLRDYLACNQEIDIMLLRDSQGNNVLHQLAYEGYLQIIRTFIEQARKTVQSKCIKKGIYNSKQITSQLTNWLNQTNNQGFTPLLYASYSGHIQVIRFLVQQFQVNAKAVTNSGQNSLHLAAQKNMIMPFLYLRQKIDLEGVDDLDSTSLHWAAYMNNQNVVAYILAEEGFKGLNNKDKEGNTALMLAVTYGNTRVVRRLLIHGADRSIKNNEGLTPLEVAIQSQFKTITKMLDQNYSIADLIKFYCNVKIQYIPKKKSYTIPMLFIITFILNAGILNALIIFSQLEYTIVMAAVFACMFLFYLSLLLNNPTVQKRQYSDMIDQFTQKSAKKICFQCRNLVPKRGYHCDICGVCIKQYDHHCTWINNCVGKSNISRFIFFLLFLILSLALIGCIPVLASITIIINDVHYYQNWFQLRFQYGNDLQKYCLLAMFLINVITSIFIVPVLLLLFVQIKNVLVNKTTFENARTANEQSKDIKDKIRRTNKVSVRNCRVMCTDNRGSFSTSKTSFSNTDIITDKFLSQKIQN